MIRYIIGLLLLIAFISHIDAKSTGIKPTTTTRKAVEATTTASSSALMTTPTTPYGLDYHQSGCSTTPCKMMLNLQCIDNVCQCSKENSWNGQMCGLNVTLTIKNQAFPYLFYEVNYYLNGNHGRHESNKLTAGQNVSYTPPIGINFLHVTIHYDSEYGFGGYTLAQFNVAYTGGSYCFKAFGYPLTPSWSTC